MEGMAVRGRLRGKGAVGRDMKAWKIREEWYTDRKKMDRSARPAAPYREMAAKGEKLRNGAGVSRNQTNDYFG